MKAIRNVGAKILGSALLIICLLALSTPARASVNVNQTSINFGSIAVGAKSAPSYVTLTNNGSRNVRFNGANVSSRQFSYGGPTGTFYLKPSQNLKVAVSFLPAAARTYSGTLTFVRSDGDRITVSLAGTGAGSATQAPSITSQPASSAVMAGQAASFSVGVSGTSPFSYQWSKNGAAIGGATSSGYTTPATTMSDSGARYTCAVGNSSGSVTSSAATLTVNAASVAPSITTQPASRAVTAGQTASFSVSVSGTSPFTYQWSKNGAAVTGAASSSYTTPATTTSDNGAQFTVVVTNSMGSVTSSTATLTVNAGTLTLTINPTGMSFGNVNIGASSTKSATVTNSGTASVTISGVSYSGAGFTTSGLSSGLILSPGQAATLDVTFTPASAGNITGSVTVASNATNSPGAVSVSASGVQVVSHSAVLSWIPSTSSVTGYQVYSSTVSGGPYTKLTTSAVSLSNYTDSTVQAGNTYYYVVTAVNSTSVESAYSNQVSAVIP